MKSQLTSVEHFVCIDGGDRLRTCLRRSPVLGRCLGGVPFRPQPDDVAFLIYTSGTTGRPKGVMLSQAGQVAAAEILGSDMRNSPSDRLLIMMPLFHIGAKIIQLAQHWRAGTVVRSEGLRPGCHSGRDRAGKDHRHAHGAHDDPDAARVAQDRHDRYIEPAHDRLRGGAHADPGSETGPEDSRPRVPAAIRTDRGDRHDAARPPAPAGRKRARPGDSHLGRSGLAARRRARRRRERRRRAGGQRRRGPADQPRNHEGVLEQYGRRHWRRFATAGCIRAMWASWTRRGSSIWSTARRT